MKEAALFHWRKHDFPRYTSRMNFVSRLLLFIAAITFFPIVTPAQTAAEKAAAVQSERYALALHNKKIIDLMSVYTPDAEFIDANGARYKGVDEIRKHFEEQFEVFDIDIHLKRNDFQQTHAFGIEHGTYTETLRRHTSGATRQVTGKFVFLHERQPNGDWLIARQEWTAKPVK